VSLRKTLSYPHVKRFYLSRLISSFGNGMGPIALAFGILHLHKTSSQSNLNGNARELGFVLGAQTLAMLCIIPFGGVLADKYGRIFMIGLADIVGGSAFLVQAYFFHTGNPPIVILFLCNAIYGIAWGIFWPAFAGVLPAIIPEELLQQGNSINQFISNGSLIIGTAIGGWLIAVFGSTWALTIDASTFVIAGMLVISLARLTPPRSHTGASMFQDLREGWQVFLSFRWIVATVAGFSFLVLIWAATDSVLGPLIALKYFHGPKSWALVMSAEAIGLLVGSLAGMRIKVRYPMRFLTIITLIFPVYVFTLARPQQLWIIAVAAFLTGVTWDLWGSVWSTAMQREVPREALSRVSAFDGLGSLLLRPVGLAIAAPLAALIGLTHLLELFSGLTVIIILTVLALPSVWRMQLAE
jgi:predicted MFS family arabinose efflux permease